MSITLKSSSQDLSIYLVFYLQGTDNHSKLITSFSFQNELRAVHVAS